MSESIEYKGININIENDDHPVNPFEDWDGLFPLMCDGGSRGLQKDYSDGAIVSFLQNYLSYNQVKINQSRLLDLMDESIEDFKNDHPLDEYDRTEVIQDELLYNWLDEDMDNMEKFCIEFNIKYLKETSRGYSQSSWSDIFICWNPAFEGITGVTYKSVTQEQLKGTAKLFSDWAWGDVYSYTIENEDEDIIDSCCGFYGDDHKVSGLLESAESNIDSYLKSKELKRQQKELKRQQKLKALIINKVSLNNRESILTQ
jgi:hypothetical protein